jgi:SAM-dependent methyltransferase
MALQQMATDQWRSPASFDDIFEAEADPWKSSTSSEQERFAVTMSMLDASHRADFDSAAELGCAEGIFTERLAPLCRCLDGLDFSEIALERARKRLARYPNVKFRHWDMRNEPLRGNRDLIVAMGVITSLYRPGDVRRMCDKIVDALQTNGFLLFSDVRQSRVFEDAWWGRFVLRGGEQIRRLLSRDPRLDLVASADTDTHVFALYRRKA